MLNPFKKQTIYIRLFENKVELRYLSKNQTITRIAENKFSNERLLIASFNNAEALIREILTEIQGKRLLTPLLVVLLQPMEKIEGGISEVEKRVFQDLAMQVGGKYYFLHETPELLSDSQVREITRT